MERGLITGFCRCPFASRPKYLGHFLGQFFLDDEAERLDGKHREKVRGRDAIRVDVICSGLWRFFAIGHDMHWPHDIRYGARD